METGNYTDWGILRTIREAKNVCRWSPWLAHRWMEEARNSLSLDYPFYEEYNNAVDYINNYWLTMKKYRWFNEELFWTKNKQPNKITLLEKI